MEDHMMMIINDTEDDTISLSNLQFEDDNNIRSTSSSSSLSCSFDQDFLGFFSEERSYMNTSTENIVFCGKIVSSKPSRSLLFGSSFDSFRFMKTSVSRQSTLRSKSVLPSFSCKSKWHVVLFMFGFGSGKFPGTSTIMDMSDIKGRQLRRRRSTVAVDDGKGEMSVGRRNGKKGWWLLVDVLGCSAGYEIERD